MLTSQELGQYCLRAFTRAVPASLAAFYRIDQRLEACEFQLHGAMERMHDSYLRHYRYMDPLQPRTCLLTGHEVVPLHEGFAHQAESNNQRYRAFLHRHGVVDVAEVFVHIDGHPVAGVSLLRRDECGRFAPRELATLHSLQEMLQLAVHVLPRQSGAPLADGLPASETPPLTRRERQLAELVRTGLSNKQLARELDIGLPTVKTHLINLYRKLGVRNRTELVAQLYLDSSGNRRH
ncbi:helix-turn-helix transcriptional regulator [Halomonas sp. WWR20]